MMNALILIELPTNYHRTHANCENKKILIKNKRGGRLKVVYDGNEILTVVKKCSVCELCKVYSLGIKGLKKMLQTEMVFLMSMRSRDKTAADKDTHTRTHIYTYTSIRRPKSIVLHKTHRFSIKTQLYRRESK